MHEQGRESAAKRGYDRAWRQYTVYYKQMHPLCADIYNFHHGRPYPVGVVDHIIPHKGDKTLFWDPKNHQPLCKRCHDHKTASEDGGFGKEVKA